MGVGLLEDGLGVMYCFVSLITGVGRDDVETRVPVGTIRSEWWRGEDGRGRVVCEWNEWASGTQIRLWKPMITDLEEWIALDEVDRHGNELAALLHYCMEGSSGRTVAPRCCRRSVTQLLTGSVHSTTVMKRREGLALDHVRPAPNCPISSSCSAIESPVNAQRSSLDCLFGTRY